MKESSYMSRPTAERALGVGTNAGKPVSVCVRVCVSAANDLSQVSQ